MSITILITINLNHLYILTIFVIDLVLRLIFKGLFSMVSFKLLLFLVRFVVLHNLSIETLVCLLNRDELLRVKFYLAILFLFFVKLLVILIIDIIVHIDINVVAIISPFMLISIFIVV